MYISKIDHVIEKIYYSTYSTRYVPILDIDQHKIIDMLQSYG
jgi:hypothetical protein